jgi:transposase
VDAAGNSVGITEGLEAARTELVEATIQVQTIQDQLTRVESRLLQLVRTTGYAEAIASIPGVSELGAALLLGELGDPSAFRNAKEWIKLAGLNLIENQSGKGKREGKRISRVGRPLLRALLYQMAVTTLRHNPVLHAAYLNLRIAGKATVKALVANMCRLLRMVFALCKSKASFATPDGAQQEVVRLKASLSERRQQKRAKAA